MKHTTYAKCVLCDVLKKNPDAPIKFDSVWLEIEFTEEHKEDVTCSRKGMTSASVHSKYLEVFVH